MIGSAMSFDVQAESGDDVKAESEEDVQAESEDDVQADLRAIRGELMQFDSFRSLLRSDAVERFLLRYRWDRREWVGTL